MLEAARNESKFSNTEVDVKREGVQIVLPDKMSLEEGIKALQHKIEQEKVEVSIYEEVDAFPLDGAAAFSYVLKDMYGWADAVPTPGFFGDQPPTMVNLEVDFGKQIQIMWGSFRVPGIEGLLKTSVAPKDGRMIFLISGKVKQKHRDEVKMIADNVRRYVREHSIYRGKAIRLKTDSDGDINFGNPPTFLDLSKVNENELTFSDDIREQVETNLFTPIVHTDACRKHRIPLKRGILLEGRYGTGKTLTAYVTAKRCRENGWTFIYLDRVAGLKTCIDFARIYGPAVIFAEDIDRVVTGERSVEIDDVLNIIDGVESKGMELITILTTNYVENIEKAMLRPGRLDAIISVLPPDKKAAEKLMRIYARDLLASSEDITEAAEELSGQIPAVIREVVERSKLYAISHNTGTELRLTGKDLAAAARGMKNHLALMAPKDTTKETAEEQVGIAMRQIIAGVLEQSTSRIEEIHDRVVN